MIADLTQANPNVMYELGLRHTQKKLTIQIGEAGRLPFDVTVTDGKTMQPSELKVNQNDTVTINITSNIDGEVHLHGYDIAFDTKAGQVVSHTFKATISGGPFDIEWESTSAHLGDLIVNP